MIHLQHVKHYRALLLAIVAAACFARFLLAPQTSLEVRGDVLLFQFWGQSAREHGLTNVYTSPIHDPMLGRVALPNYLPPYLYVVWVASTIQHLVAPATQVGSAFASVVFKTPSILADALIVLVLAALVRKRYGDGWALGVGALYAFVPFTVLDGIFWGQIDAVNTLFMVLCVWMLAQRKFSWATLCFTIALFVKLQSVVLLPLLVFEVLREGKLKDIWRTALTGIGTALVLCAPFLLAGHSHDVAAVFTGSAGMYPLPSANAFNFWWLFSGGYWTARSDHQLFHGIPYVAWGGMLFAAATLFALWFRQRVRAEHGLWLTAAFLAFSFFMLPTEMHERYLFPFFALLLPVLPRLRLSRWLYAALSVTFTWNLVVTYVTLKVERHTVLGNFWGGSLVVALINVGLFVATLVWYVQLARQKQQP